MSKIEVTVKLPYLLQVMGSFNVRYEAVCQDDQLDEFFGRDVELEFLRANSGETDKSGWTLPHTAVSARAETNAPISDQSAGTFAVRNMVDILNRVVLSYQAATREVSNAGFITLVGTTFMQLFAHVTVDGRDIIPNVSDKTLI